MKLSTSIKAALLLFLLAVIIYSNSLGGEFIYDDGYFIIKNIHIKNLENIPLFFVMASSGAFAELAQDVYRPLTTVSFALDYHFWKLNTFCYHLENVLLHSFNAVLLFVLLWLIFGDVAVAFLASALFACHPVQTEVVAWISGRSSALFLFFYLASFICYVRFRKGGGRAYAAVSVAACAIALFSKEMAVSLPLMLVAYDMHFGDKSTLRQKLRRYAPYFFLAAFYVAARALVLQRVSQCEWWGGNPYNTFLSMVPAIAGYIKLLFLPVDLRSFYVLPIRSCIADTQVLAALALVGGIVASMPFVFRRSRAASFGVWWFFITLLPVSNIVPLRALMAERFLYLPSIGFCILAALFFRRLASARPGRSGGAAKNAAIILAAALVMLYSARTMLRNEDWKTPVTITGALLKADPMNPWGLTSMGVSYITQERYDLAVKPLVKAILLSDGNFSPKSTLGFCYLQLGRYDDAVRILEDAVRIKPCHLDTLNSLGVAYANLKKYDKAIQQFEKAIAVDRHYVTAYINLGTAYDHAGDSAKAIETYGLVGRNTRSKEDIAIAYVRIGDIYSKMKDPVRAKENYRKAVDLCGRNMEDLRKIATDRLNARFVEK